MVERSQIFLIENSEVVGKHPEKPSPEDIITELSRRLTQTLTHAPSKLMRKAAREGDNELLDFVVSGLQDSHRSHR